MSLFTHKLAEFYPYAVHILFTLVLTASFEMAQDVFIPIGEVTKYSQQINSFALFFIYFIIISGWIGYARSVSRRPHTDTTWGTLRFVIDILIILTIFYLSGLAEPVDFQAHFMETFMWVIPALFFLYTIWDSVRYVEYSSNNIKYADAAEKQSEQKILTGRLKTTIFFFLITISQSLLYFNFSPALTLASSIYSTYAIFIISSITLIALYRYVKWDFPSLRIYHAE